MNPLLILEPAVLVEGQEWTRQRLAGRLQRQVDAWGSLGPQSGQALAQRKRQRLKLDTCAGQSYCRVGAGIRPD